MVGLRLALIFLLFSSSDAFPEQPEGWDAGQGVAMGATYFCTGGFIERCLGPVAGQNFRQAYRALIAECPIPGLVKQRFKDDADHLDQEMADYRRRGGIPSCGDPTPTCPARASKDWIILEAYAETLARYSNHEMSGAQATGIDCPQESRPPVASDHTGQ